MVRTNSAEASGPIPPTTPRCVLCSFSMRVTRARSGQVGQVKGVEEDAEREDDDQQVALEGEVETEPFARVLPLERLDHVGVEVALPPDALVGEQVLYPLGFLLQQEGAARGVEAELLAVDDNFGDEAVGDLPQDVLLRQAVELDVRRNLSGELDHVDVEERVARLDRVGERHLVAVVCDEV